MVIQVNIYIVFNDKYIKIFALSSKTFDRHFI